MQYNYNMHTDEFEPKPDHLSPEEWETGNITGNRVFVTKEAELGPRFRVDIDDFGSVVAAMNRLVRWCIPTFQPF